MVGNQTIPQIAPRAFIEPKPAPRRKAPLVAFPLQTIHIDQVGNPPHAEPCTEKRRIIAKCQCNTRLALTHKMSGGIPIKTNRACRPLPGDRTMDAMPTLPITLKNISRTQPEKRWERK